MLILSPVWGKNFRASMLILSLFKNMKWTSISGEKEAISVSPV